jgi:DNA topoisomerase IB
VRRGDLGREQVLACAVRLLDVGMFVVGGEDYPADNDSYGRVVAGHRSPHQSQAGRRPRHA